MHMWIGICGQHAVGCMRPVACSLQLTLRLTAARTSLSNVSLPARGISDGCHNCIVSMLQLAAIADWSNSCIHSEIKLSHASNWGKRWVWNLWVDGVQGDYLNTIAGSAGRASTSSALQLLHVHERLRLTTGSHRED